MNIPTTALYCLLITSMIVSVITILRHLYPGDWSFPKEETTTSRPRHSKKKQGGTKKPAPQRKRK
jgi:hypothetical protein